MKATDMNTDIAANDLTQLSSREQLSALMDSALPADQTRFLLRRLQHDAPLAECWERWRTAGEVMRGLAPSRRMPADFASKVSAALHGDAVAAKVARPARTPAWLRWGGGAAMAASLAVVALLARQPANEASQPAQIAATTQPPASAPAQPLPVIETGAQLATAATAVASAARPSRVTQRRAMRSDARLQTATDRASTNANTDQIASAEPAVQAPQPDIVTRPWPRSVLPQYGSGGLTVGFGDHARGAAPYNPFQAPALSGILPIDEKAANAADAGREQRSGDSQP